MSKRGFYAILFDLFIRHNIIYSLIYNIILIFISKKIYSTHNNFFILYKNNIFIKTAFQKKRFVIMFTKG